MENWPQTLYSGYDCKSRSVKGANRRLEINVTTDVVVNNHDNRTNLFMINSVPKANNVGLVALHR